MSLKSQSTSASRAFAIEKKVKDFVPNIQLISDGDSNLIDCTETFLILDVLKCSKQHKKVFSCYSYSIN